TFSKVYRAIVKGDLSRKQDYALKYLVPTSRPSRIASELQCLKEVGGSNNIVGIEFCIMNDGHVVIVMPYYPHQRFSDYFRLLTVNDIRDYMRNLFIALSKIHAHGIIHRDVKPNNFLYCKSQKSYILVDFGLAERTDFFSSKHSETRQPLSDSTGRLNKSVQNMIENSANFDKQVRESIPSSVNISRYQAMNSSKRQENASKKRKLAPSTSTAINETLPVVNAHTKSSIKQYPLHSKPRDGSKHSKSSKGKECGCFRKPTVCSICLGRDPEEAPRGGTPGFRAPEVLLKHPHQTTAIDMWSAGVILLCMLSKKYPFFRADDDITTLAEITFIVGTREIKDAALSLGKVLTMNLPETTESISEIRKQLSPARYLQALCTMIQHEQPCQVHSYSNERDLNLCCVFCPEMSQHIPESAYDLLDKLLDPNPQTRITASEALNHPFISEC
ncbi:cell division cycle 7-related protein kinase-like, partial [Stegodyphus dumicola]|uniref:cell division cycle 7-related protein kinase-like n=1 Tax=Stegodyphus dumicola TaxID=202533 RepID=UPI0015AC9B8A